MKQPKEPLKLMSRDDLKTVLAKIVAAPKRQLDDDPNRPVQKKGPRRSEARD